ncbi:MAG TPA: hypothetical protein VIM69_04235 [Opitutaceae bacterium]
MSPKLARLLTRFYSPEWRARYGEEFAFFLEDNPASIKVCWDVVKTGLSESVAQRLRRRARAFRGIVSSRPARLTSATLALSAIVAFAAAAEATPLLAMHRSAENFLTCSSDTRIRYEPGAAQFAITVSNLLPQAIDNTHCQSLNRAFAVYIFANDKTWKTFVAQPRAGTRGAVEPIYLLPQDMSDPAHILTNLEDHLLRLKVEDGRSR